MLIAPKETSGVPLRHQTASTPRRCWMVLIDGESCEAQQKARLQTAAVSRRCKQSICITHHGQAQASPPERQAK
jgi:hypothetical protein